MRLSPRRGLLKWSRFVLLAALLGVMGCRPPVGAVTGKISYQGALLKGGNVTFVSTEGKGGRSATIREDGSYIIEKLPQGNYKIAVETESLNPALLSGAPTYSPPPGMKDPRGKHDPAARAQRYVQIPGRYADPETSDQTCTLASGQQEHNINLLP